MKQIRISKRRTHRGDTQQEPLRLDPRGPDIVKAHQLARSSGSYDASRRDSRQLPA